MFKRGLTAFAMAAALTAVTVGGNGAIAGAQKNAKIDPAARLVFGMNMAGGGFSQRLEPSASTSICDQSVGNQVFGTLIRRDTKTNKPVPNLAESWEIVDPSTFTFKLRPNLTFQDGTKLDAAAAKASIDKSRAPTSALARRATTLGLISSVEAGADGRTVTLRLSQPVAGILPLTLAGSEGMVAAAASTDTNPIGAGPFKFDSQTVGQQIKLSKFPGYWDAKNVKLAGIDYVHTDTAQNAVNSVIAGDLDMIEGAGLANAAAENDPNTKIEHANGGDYWKININTAKPPFDNVDFRKAINYAIDKTAIAKAIFGDDYELATQSYPSNFVDQYQKDLANMYPYSVKKAKAALKKSGVQTPITVQGVGPANNPNFARFGEIVQANLKEIGINVELTQSPNILTTFFANKQGDFVTTLWPARADPSVTILRNFTPNQVTNAGNNLSPEIPAALAEIQAAATPAESRPGYKKAINTIVNEAYEVPVFFPGLTNVHRTYVVSDDWQIYGTCQGVDFSKVAITKAKG
jgi:peptide/nickel transport system substrate-binding protein